VSVAAVDELIVGKPAIAKFLGKMMALLASARTELVELRCFDIDVTGD
jgi:hypothetical protein